jgi:hypothetical protein
MPGFAIARIVRSFNPEPTATALRHTDAVAVGSGLNDAE